MRIPVCAALAALSVSTLATTVGAQGTSRDGAPATAADAVADAIARWIRLDAPAGVEELAHAPLRRVLGAGWNADRMGNLVKRVGSGLPRRVIACAMDVPSLAVSAITDDGYVRLHRAGTPSHPLWDQFHEAQQIRVITRRGSVAGVVAVANGHFARQHRGDTTVVTVDGLWVDVGASTRAEVEALGVTLLDPVVAERPAWTFEGNATGPAAGARAGCAAVATAANAGVSTGETVFVLSSQRAFGWVGLAGVLARLGTVDAITLFEQGSVAGEQSTIGVSRLGARQRAIARVLRRDSVRVVAPRVRHAGSLVETIAADEARMLLQLALRHAGAAAGGEPASEPSGFVAPALDTTRVRMPRTDRFEALERTFATIADLPGVPKHEWRVRDAIFALLPAWARRRATVDSLGNLIVAVGPDRDSVAFIAHMDEVAFEVEAIARDGTVRLGRRGGVVITAWEGQPAMLHFDPAPGATSTNSANVPLPLRGLFIPRDSARVKSPRELSAWFGLDSSALVARGVRVGSAVTAYKRGARLAGARFTARGSDDRTGSTALLHALAAIDPATLPRKVLFVWSTQEESGLVGAGHFGAVHGRSLARVYSVDTFVSSDTPLEERTFAYAPLGAGPVMRVLDDGAIMPRAERDRVREAARLRGIPLQTGTTHGATDGSSIAPYGAPNIGLSWPGRYSHSPAEVLDFRDVDGLVRLIAALATMR